MRVFAGVLFLLGSVCCAGEALANGVAVRALEEARRIERTLKKTEYSHTTKVDEDGGNYAVDCSGYVCYVLKKVSNAHYKDVPKGKYKRPLAVSFYEHFLAAPAADVPGRKWRRVEKIADAAPGDLMAWRREELTPGENTGHIVFVNAAPVRESDGQYRVEVLDSTASGHGNDPRKEGANGIGRGTMWFSVDGEGRPVAYRWKSAKGTLREENIAIGRAVDEKGE